jgi:hypothetical protein
MRAARLALMLTFVSPLAAGLLSVTSASAWWMRIPGFTCVSPTSGAAVPYMDSGQPADAGFPSVAVQITSTVSSSVSVLCPFFDTTSSVDNTATTIAVDLMNPSASQEASGNLSLEACTYSSWTNSCGSSSSSPTIDAGSHGTVDLSVTAWTDDTGDGYAYVFGTEKTDLAQSYIVGVYVSGT